MTIDKLGSINPIQNYNKNEKTGRAAPKAERDSISVSSEAKAMGEVFQVAEAVRETPDIRMERIAEVKAKLNNPDYINDTVINSVADKIIDMFNV